MGTYISEFVDGICLDNQVVLLQFLLDLVQAFRYVLGLQAITSHTIQQTVMTEVDLYTAQLGYMDKVWT